MGIRDGRANPWDMYEEGRKRGGAVGFFLGFGTALLLALIALAFAAISI